MEATGLAGDAILAGWLSLSVRVLRPGDSQIVIPARTMHIGPTLAISPDFWMSWLNGWPCGSRGL